LTIPILLETSALISLSTPELEKYVSECPEITISPYTFWELLYHLDEDWSKKKGQICKCSRVKILDDPRAVNEIDLQYRVERLNNRVPDSRLIPKIIECLEKANSIDAFYNISFFDEIGKMRLIKGCSKRVQEALDEKEDKYLAFVKKILDYFDQGGHNLDSDHDCHNAIMSLVEGAVITSQQNSIQMQMQDMRNQVIEKYYLYFAYIFERTKKLLKNGCLQPERNDYEDGLICLHLHLNKPLIFVTKDKGLSDALINSLNRIKKLEFNLALYPIVIYIQNKLNLTEIKNTESSRRD